YEKWKSQLRNVAHIETRRFGSGEKMREIVEAGHDQTVLFEFQIQFQPNQKTFEEAVYAADFERVLDVASRYGGAVIEVVGHADPSRVKKLKAEGATEPVVQRTVQSALNLSLARANEVRDALLGFGKGRSIAFDPSQFVTVGRGVTEPLYPAPKTKEEWQANMRVVFRILNVEAEMAE